MALFAFSTVVLLFCAAGGMLVSMHGSRASVNYVIDSVQPPMNQLLAVERANEAGQDAFAAAVAATGDERTEMLAQAVVGSQDTKVAWTRYRALSLDLPGEAELIAKYTADQVEVTDQTTAALVPILTSTELGVIPQAQIEAHAAVSQDLVELHTLYREADHTELARFERLAERSDQLVIAETMSVMLIVAITTVISLRRAQHVVKEREQRRSENRLASFETRLRRGLELVDDDESAYEVAERAVREMSPGLRVSLLVADESDLRLTAISEAPACAVVDGGDCPALRTGLTVSFGDSSALDACPTLALNTTEPCSATCVPLKVAGHTAGVLHLAAQPGQPPDSMGATDLVARAVGDRVTMLQALATFRSQAARDPLTGLLNRRSLGNAVEHVLSSGRHFAVAFGDLDHFKQINDDYGHEAGDAALRSFSRTLRDSVRPEDIVCRWGGEEFVVVLPECSATTAVDAMNRVRTNLSLAALAGETIAVTASFGIAESGDHESFDEVVARADIALRQAKTSGRDRVVWIDEPPRLALGPVI